MNFFYWSSKEIIVGISYRSDLGKTPAHHLSGFLDGETDCFLEGLDVGTREGFLEGITVGGEKTS